MFIKGHHQSEEARKKISKEAKRVGVGKWMIGRKFSEETKKKISESNKGKHNYNVSNETRKKMSESQKKNPNRYWKGRLKSDEHKKKISDSLRGKHHTEETKRKMSLSHLREKSYLWKGGISFEPYSIDWTKTLKRAIRERDNYICQVCNQYGCYIHHIDYDKKNCNSENLITLCNSCHTKTNHNREYWTNYFKQIKC